MFQPIALKTLGPVNESSVQFLNDLGHKITPVSADDKERQFIYLLILFAQKKAIIIAVGLTRYQYMSWTKKPINWHLQLPIHIHKKSKLACISQEYREVSAGDRSLEIG